MFANVYLREVTAADYDVRSDPMSIDQAVVAGNTRNTLVMHAIEPLAAQSSYNYDIVVW